MIALLEQLLQDCEVRALLVHGALGAACAMLARRRRPVRIWIDGCYDLTHFGHFNAFRQARALGDHLIVGINPDKEVIRYKGSPPVNTDEEREAVVKACKWVDEVVLDVPYVLDQKYLDEVVFGKYKCDFVVHGDDPCLDPDGNDVYALTKRLGKYIEIKRTEGVSTTDLLGRMLQPGDKIVYVDGSFDLFHLHHIEFLRRARALGNFLIVGVHKDEVVNQYKGYAFPVMNLMERVLAVLACRYVDEVVIGAPWEVTQDLLNTFNVSVVAHGGSFNATVGGADDYHRAYRVPKEKGMYHVIAPDPQSPGAKRGDMQMVTSILDRVEQQRTVMSAKFAKKAKAEQNYYENVKTYVQES